MFDILSSKGTGKDEFIFSTCYCTGEQNLNLPLKHEDNLPLDPSTSQSSFDQQFISRHDFRPSPQLKQTFSEHPYGNPCMFSNPHQTCVLNPCLKSHPTQLQNSSLEPRVMAQLNSQRDSSLSPCHLQRQHPQVSQCVDSSLDRTCNLYDSSHPVPRLPHVNFQAQGQIVSHPPPVNCVGNQWDMSAGCPPYTTQPNSKFNIAHSPSQSVQQTPRHPPQPAKTYTPQDRNLQSTSQQYDQYHQHHHHQQQEEQQQHKQEQPQQQPQQPQQPQPQPQQQQHRFEFSVQTWVHALPTAPGRTPPLPRATDGETPAYSPDQHTTSRDASARPDCRFAHLKPPSRQQQTTSVVRAGNWNVSRLDSHAQGLAQSQTRRSPPGTQLQRQIASPAPGTPPGRVCMMSACPSTPTCAVPLSSCRHSAAAGALQPFPHLEQPAQARQRNILDQRQAQQRMERRTDEQEPWYMSPDPPWTSTGGSSEAPWDGGAGPGNEQRATPPTERRWQPGQQQAANLGRCSSSNRVSSSAHAAQFYEIPPTSSNHQTRSGRTDVGVSGPMTSLARVTSLPRAAGQHGQHRLSQSAGNLRRPHMPHARRTSDSDIPRNTDIISSSMYRTGETCTINPLQFAAFGQDMKPLDINMSGDFINFDFTPTQFNDLFGFPVVADEAQEMECALDEEVMPIHEVHPPVKVEKLETAGCLMAPPASQYDEDMDQVQQLIVREVMGDILTACQLIDIPTDPYSWNTEQVQKWVEWTRHQYRLPEIDIVFFAMDGMRLCSLTDEEFRQILPKSGDILYAHLDIWKNAARMNIADEILSPNIPVPQVPVEEGCNYMDLGSLGGYETSSSVSNSDDEVSIPSPSPTGPNTHMTPNHTGSIHLWQFLKELLLQPDSYGYCIRWLDRTQGIFKIEDSVEVARLWGLRKNRPAMNYDKLSRSIRQYYRKGIMKKTEVAQRLVYQFVHPC